MVLILKNKAFEINPYVLKKYACFENAPRGDGVKVGIVSAFSYDGAVYDLEKFCNQYGICFYPPEIKHVFENKTAGYKSWHKETAATLQYIRAFAPGCRQTVYITGSDSFSDLIYAIEIAERECDIICLNFGVTEFLHQKRYSYFFEKTKKLFVCAAGNCKNIQFPASNKDVLCVGGVYVDFSQDTTVLNQRIPKNSANGYSEFEICPIWQKEYSYNGKRKVPDISFFAYGKTGAVIYFNQKKETVCGTSLACSCITGICAGILSVNTALLTKKAELFYEISKTTPYSFKKISSGKDFSLSGGLGVPNVCEILKNI